MSTGALSSVLSGRSVKLTTELCNAEDTHEVTPWI
jgi:hypothetical protein